MLARPPVDGRVYTTLTTQEADIDSARLDGTGLTLTPSLPDLRPGRRITPVVGGNGDRDDTSMISRVTSILGAFTSADDALGPSELSRRTGLAKSTAARIANELAEFNLLERCGTGFRLGLLLFELGESAARPRDLRKVALASMADLRNAVGLTVHLAVLQRFEVVYLEILRARGTPRLPSRVGGRMPAYATGVGKALLAAAPPAVLEEILSGELAPVGPRTITSSNRLRSDLARVRQTGVAYEQEESGPGVACAASAVTGHDGVALAAISAAGWSRDFDVRRVGLAVRTAAESISRQIARRPGSSFNLIG